MSLNVVIAGLDPAIHRAVQHLLHASVDARVKPGHDEKMLRGHPSPTGGEGKRRLAR